MQEGQCGGDTRYRTGNPTEALLVNRRFSMRSTGVLFVGWTDGNFSLSAVSPCDRCSAGVRMRAQCHAVSRLRREVTQDSRTDVMSGDMFKIRFSSLRQMSDIF